MQESSKNQARIGLHRPFTKQSLYWNSAWNEEQYQLPSFFPEKDSRNFLISTTRGKFSALVGLVIPDHHFIGDVNAYPLYCYDKLGTRHCAISSYALNLFRTHYKDNSITEEEIFYYIYAIFHHKGYLEKYKNSLSKEAPRIGLSKDFKELSKLGKTLAELYLNYESEEIHTSVEYKEGMLADTEEGIMM